QDTDSHISDCDGPDPFPIKVCCKVDADTVPPVFVLSEPSDEWINETSFPVTWSATDDKSIVICSNVVWSNNPAGPWQPISVGATTTNCPANPASGSVTFGPSEPVLVRDDLTYYFTGNATDELGNTGTHIQLLNTTVDRYYPEIYTEVTDDQGRTVDNGLVEPGATKIYLNFSATDNISGVLVSTLHYRVTWQGSVDSDVMTCGSAPHHGGWSNCTKGFNYDTDTTIKYYTEATDRAGNTYRTGYGFITSHMLANFGISSLYLTMGDTFLVPVIVRNMQALPDTINLSLSEYEHVAFEHDCNPYDCIMGSNRRELSVLNVSPYDERTYYIRVLSSERGEYYPTVSAKSELDPSIEDAHALTLTTGYPVYFPGLSDLAVAFLIIASALVMFIASRKSPASFSHPGGGEA
ncbi:MAG: hypothetical protein KAT35_01190, partial [Candidatus Aenigmarchaeota archaeon]|nr:hypothetical protein [Candidatus Aenigmarchaeota archaeon]